MTDPPHIPGDDGWTRAEVTALEKLKAEAANIRIANRIVLTTGLFSIGAGILIMPYSGTLTLLLFVGGGYLAFLSTSKTPTQIQKRNLPQLASTQDLEALKPLCEAVLCSDRILSAMAETALGALVRLQLASDSSQMKSEAAVLLKILTHTYNVDLIYSLLDWVVVAQPENAVRALDRLARSRQVSQNSALAEAVAASRATVIAARQQKRSGDDLLRASSSPIQRDLLLPVEPTRPVDHSNLLRPIERSEDTHRT